MTFWILSLLLLLPALLIFLWPVLNVRKHQTEEDRTALNVALYQERVAELEAQHATGVLTDEQLEQGKGEAGRDLLEDTEQGAPLSQSRLGMLAPLIAAILIPLTAIGLYQVYGEGDKVALTASLVEQPASDEEAIARLEKMTEFQPESADAWFFLARLRMESGRYQQAADAFRQTLELVGRQPEVLAHWAQAEYFASGNQWDSELQKAVDEVMAVNPHDPVMLGFIGIAGFESGNFNVALDAWQRLLDQTDPRDPSAQAILTGVERAEQAVARFGRNNPEAKPGPILSPLAGDEQPQLSAEQGRIVLQVSLAESLQAQVQPEDVVFVFARNSQAGQAPLAAQRLLAGQLPAEVVLSDADALMPANLLSDAQSVEVQASIARDGNASKPDWVSDRLAVEVDSEQPRQLVVEHKSAAAR